MAFDVNDQFPLLAQSTYVNTPGSGLLSKDILTWRRQHDQDYFNTGSSFRINQESFLREVKQSVSDFFRADAGYTYLVPNFSFGINTFLDGLSATERFLMLEEDYPSVTYAVRSRGFQVDTVPVDEQLEDRILTKIREFKPTAFAFSLVQYINGIKLDMGFIKKLKAENPELLLIADGTQYCGTERVDFMASGLDFLGASGYKWMLAGYGNGFVFLSKGSVDRLYRCASKQDLPTEPFLNQKTALSLCFEPGHLDTLSFGTLQRSIDYFNNIGMETVEAAIRNLSLKARTAFLDRGLLADAVSKRPAHSSIFSLSVNDAVYKRLQESNVICMRRGSGVRVGFHFFNSEADLISILSILDQIHDS
ncbi:aminotransferase class V-fold PLP-dependent enzyme [Olivibacter sp. XZL3]|uniref:aminotransferase class V-fold PLP-dependent enzyme n=1 Tax=Olivibacter sp. XZL3 TaxID=1735116 RepID=UPI001066D429|nr:aminotransferase class V-fold PLP-dependent enzyme [Olivibacter sp. XZL3]